MAAAELHFAGASGTELFYRAWLPEGDAPVRRAVLLLHRGHEHSERWTEVAKALAGAETGVFAWDARGHGRSPGVRGDADHFSVYAKDLDLFARHVCATHELQMEDLAVVAHSVGAVVATAWVHDYGPPIRALVLATPAFRVKLYVPLALPGLRLWQQWRPGAFIKSYVGGKLLTHDKTEAARYDADPLVSRQISVRILLGLQDAARRLLDDAGAIRTPTLVLAAGNDAVVRYGPQRRFYEGLSSRVKEFALLEGFSHAIFHETGRADAIERVTAFLNHLFSLPPASPEALLKADEAGYTKTEYDRLRRPLPVLAPRRLNFAAQRLGLKTLLRLSKGVREGWASGFDSGQSLDYVYENRPQGLSALGRFIDRRYLSAIGWRGIRQRRVHLEAAIAEAIGRIHAAGKPVRLLDIAAGPGRYLLETMRRAAGVPVTARLRDRSETALAAGRALAARMGLDGAVTYEIGDAFDRLALAAIDPKPTIAVVSGLYELFPANAPVLASLQGLSAGLAPGGELIYTNQPWHPQVEMIARTLRNRDGAPWVMRRRTQAEMDALVRAAGFIKTGMEIDQWGIFTVSTARKA